MAETVGNKIVLGIDGGGTRTRGAVANLSGLVLARHVVGPTNPHVVGVDAALANVRALVDHLLDEINADKSQIVAWCCGLAGADRPEDQRPFLRLAEEYRCGDRMLITTDALVALAGGTLSDRGVLVHAGTGSIVYGRDDKTTARVGGWGSLLDDGGSGYAIGRAALRHVMRAHDGREDATALSRMLLDQLALDDETQLVRWVGAAGVADIAQLAETVFQAARDEEPAAVDIVERAGDDLALMVRALGRKIAVNGQAVIVFSGGLFDNTPEYRELVGRKIRLYFPDVPLCEPKMPPLAGALLYSLHHAGVRIDKPVLNAMKESIDAPAQPPSRPAFESGLMASPLLQDDDEADSEGQALADELLDAVGDLDMEPNATSAQGDDDTWNGSLSQPDESDKPSRRAAPRDVLWAEDEPEDQEENRDRTRES